MNLSAKPKCSDPSDFLWGEKEKETGDFEMSEQQAETCLRLKCVTHKSLSLSIQPPRSSQTAPRRSVLYIPPALYRSSTTAN